MATLPAEPLSIIEHFGPHRAYADRPHFAAAGEPDRLVKTHCCFCGQQCGIQLKVKDERLGPGALTVPRFSDHPAAARGPGPAS